ncbi:HalOD1 output domain-containing protein [Natrialbaceae archaeon A-arb3/5]
MTSERPTDGGADRVRGSSAYTTEIGVDERPNMAVVRAVAAVTGRSPLDLDPLYESIDPDHANRVVDAAGSRRSAVELSFEYGGCAVTVTSDEVTVRLLGADSK